ncbi:MAG: zinc-dependent metalloprotease, partial [Planctomycetota bacterium]
IYWKKYGKRLALIAENIGIRGSDDESKASVERIFTDRVLLDVPILTMVPRGGPMIDLDDLFVRNASVFFGSRYRASRGLINVKKAKSYEKNTEIAFEIPVSGGGLKTLHYSVSKIEGTPGFKPRKADQRIGYFTTTYEDYGKYESDETDIRFINRWHLEKRDPKLKLSPPKKPIVFYIEHTTPVRYRRWVRQGILNWNKAFEKIGIIDAVEVRQQDKQTNAHMDKDPENVQFNFVRWLNNNISTAIGPSRVDPRTGEILDADIVLTDGWIRVFEDQFDELMPKISMQGVSPETLAWYAEHPNWDPRVRLATPSQRNFVRESIQHQATQQFHGHTQSGIQTAAMGDDVLDGLVDRVSQTNGACFAAEGKGYDVALMRMMQRYLIDDKKDEKETSDDKKEDEEDAKEEEQMLDGMPESFIGPLLADLVSHEVGHTLGLRHNFKASSIYSLAEINSEELKGKKPLAGSVMDYLPTNFNFESGEVQGDYAMIGVGPYDLWAIEYGYTTDKKKLPKILSRVAEPELSFGTDEDTIGPDPLARRYDFSQNPLDFATNQVKLAKHHREKILEDFVKDGDSWSKARQGYLLTLRLQTQATSMMANWIGGTFVNRDKKGDPNGRKPIEVVPTEQQREALEFVIENTMFDEAFGLSPELLLHMTSDPWRGGFFFSASNEPAWPIH